MLIAPGGKKGSSTSCINL